MTDLSAHVAAIEKEVENLKERMKDLPTQVQISELKSGQKNINHSILILILLLGIFWGIEINTIGKKVQELLDKAGMSEAYRALMEIEKDSKAALQQIILDMSKIKENRELSEKNISVYGLFFEPQNSEFFSYHESCNGEARDNGKIECLAAAHRFCLKKGYVAGFLQEGNDKITGIMCVVANRK